MDFHQDNEPHNNDRDPYNHIGNNGSYYNRHPYYSPRSIAPRGDYLAKAAMVLGILTIVSFVFMTIYLPFIFGGLGIILAILSKGASPKMSGSAKAGIACCTAGLVLNFLLCVLSIWLLFAMPSLLPDMMDEMNQICQQMYGISYEELMNGLFNSIY